MRLQERVRSNVYTTHVYMSSMLHGYVYVIRYLDIYIVWCVIIIKRVDD